MVKSKILITYFTLTGNTKAIAYKLREILNGKGFEVSVKSINEVEEDLKPWSYIILGFPVHAFKPPKKVLNALRRWSIKNKNFILFCTYALTGDRRALSIVETVIKAKGGKVLLSAGIKARSSFLIMLGLRAKFSVKDLEKFIRCILQVVSKK